MTGFNNNSALADVVASLAAEQRRQPRRRTDGVSLRLLAMRLAEPELTSTLVTPRALNSQNEAFRRHRDAGLAAIAKRLRNVGVFVSGQKRRKCRIPFSPEAARSVQRARKRPNRIPSRSCGSGLQRFLLCCRVSRKPRLRPWASVALTMWH
jgi:hypothetical protein